MEDLKKERTHLRRAFTKLVNKVQEMLKAGAEEQSAAQIQINLLEGKVNRLFQLDEDILKVMVNSEASDEEIDEEIETADAYKIKWISVKVYKDHQVCNIIDTSVVNSQVNASVKRNFILPKIDLFKFNGDIRNWFTFWGQFQKIHSDGSIDDHDKMQYLLQATEAGSAARSVVESFPPSGDNYSKAIGHLKDRFAREDLLIDVYVRDLLNLILSQTKSTQELSLSVIYDKLSTQLRALETLGVTTDKCASILYPMVESVLPEDILRAYERQQVGKDKTKGTELTDILLFLKGEVDSNERIRLARTGLHGSFSYDSPNGCSPEPSGSCLLTAEAKRGISYCIWCEKPSHNSVECYKGQKLTLDQRKELLKKRKACYICLRVGHNAKICKSSINCIMCSRRHNILMCPEIPKYKDGYESEQRGERNQTADSTEMPVNSRTTTLLQTLMVRLVNGNNQVTVRAVIDNGAQHSNIKAELAQRLNLQPKARKTLSHCVFGGIKTRKKDHIIYEFTVQSLFSRYSFKILTLSENKICGNLPKINVLEVHRLLKGHDIELSDIGNNSPDVDFLIGADYSGYLLTGKFIHLGNGLVAILTKLGWTLQGPKKNVNQVATTLLSMSDLDITDLWSLESIGIKDNPSETLSEAIALFKNKLTRIDGRYQVSLPWREVPRPQANYVLAKKRLDSTTTRLKQLGKLDDYDGVFKQWLSEGIIELASSNSSTGHYLPHHAVIKESSSTTKVRPVFDASCKDEKGVSLNSCIEKGDNLLELIPRLLIDFRLRKIGVTADIKQAFLQISVDPVDRDYLKFLWWTNINETSCKLVTYRHRRVVFGVRSSPFHLSATIAHHLDETLDVLMKTAQKLKNSFYVDNCITSVDSREELDTFISESRYLMGLAKFELRGWVAAPITYNDYENENISILGLIWNTVSDTMCCNIPDLDIPLKVTKRIVLSITQKVFDPIGFTAPTMLVPKLILQRAWECKGGWDDELPHDIRKDFELWIQKAYLIKFCNMPRRLIPTKPQNGGFSLHVFSDACKLSYGICIFLRTQDESDVHIKLVTAKSRVAPSKQRITIPRLELIAALMAARLGRQTKDSLNLDCPTYYWTDSSVALTWIRKESQWATFVQNRVSEIRKLTNSSDWFHITGAQNPADLPSRGCDAQTLLDSKWWEGPNWLKLDPSSWPHSFILDEPRANEEIQSRITNILAIQGTPFSERLRYFSRYTKIVRMVAWIFRFKWNCMEVEQKRNNKELSGEEYKFAEKRLLGLIQRENFDISTLKLNKTINIVVSEDGILHVKTKLQLSNNEETFKWPLLLPQKDVLVQRLVRYKHEDLQHAGIQIMKAELRQFYWIIGIRKLARKIVETCSKCRRHSSRPICPAFAPLPLNRVDEKLGVFQVCGVDLTGPLFMRSGEKAYIVLFTCSVFRAVHLELTLALSTESFLLALRRFIARRGRVNDLL